MQSKGYIFETEDSAKETIDSINAHFGIPLNADVVTTTYTNYEQRDDVWVIRYFPELVDILGKPIVLPELENEHE